MYNNYKIVVNTAAGRRRYMQYLIPYIVSSEVVDRYDIWINTHNMADIEFFKVLAQKYPVINLVWQPDGVVNGVSTINAFYKDCIEEKTIYFKLDDDIVWMEPNLIEKMIKFRIENPEYFLVSPLVINNSLTTYLLQISNKLHFNQYYNSSSSHSILWKSGTFASQLHNWFISEHIFKNTWSTLYLGKKEMGMTRFSINAILWFGDEMKKINGNVTGDDEEFLSCIYPTKMGLSNAWNGDAIIAHFAFFTQREELDNNNILEQYGNCIKKYSNENSDFQKIYDDIQLLMSDIKNNEEVLMRKKSPYKAIFQKKTFQDKVKNLFPVSILKIWDILNDNKKDNNIYIDKRNFS